MSIASSLRPQCSWIQSLGAFTPGYLHFTMRQEIPMIVPGPKGQCLRDDIFHFITMH